MSFQEKSRSAKKTQGDRLSRFTREVSEDAIERSLELSRWACSYI